MIFNVRINPWPREKTYHSPSRTDPDCKLCGWCNHDGVFIIIFHVYILIWSLHYSTHSSCWIPYIKLQISFLHNYPWKDAVVNFRIEAFRMTLGSRQQMGLRTFVFFADSLILPKMLQLVKSSTPSGCDLFWWTHYFPCTTHINETIWWLICF